MVIKILGSGCSNCQKLEAHAKKAVDELGIDAEIIKVTEYPDIMAFGIMTTPALVIDEQVLFAGHVPSFEAVKGLIARAE
jgi:small redox-active disulfide protein 2